MTARFAIDVGGTFTDCVAVDAQQRRQRLKVLSSSVVKGVATGAAERWIDPMRRADAVGFWRDATLRSLDANGMPHDEARVLESDPSTGLLLLERPLQGVGDRPISYELTRGEPAPLLAIRQALRLAGDEPIPAVDVRLGTTRGTNALLTRSGARTAWVTTRGFADALSIGDQQRPRLFELAIRKPSELFAATAEIDERLDAHGQVLIPIDLEQTRRELERLRAAGIESLAICLLHAYLAPEHELQVARIARELGFPAIRLSHQSAPVIKLVARGRRQTEDLVKELEKVLESARGEVEGRTAKARKTVEKRTTKARKRAERTAGKVARSARDAADEPLAQADKLRRRAGVGSSFPITGYDELTAAQVGARHPVLMENPRMGRTPQFAEVDFDTDQPEGAIVSARITGAAASRLQATAAT